MAVILQESFAGVRVIKSFAREDYQASQFSKSSDLQCRNSMRVRKSMDIVQPLIESVSAFGVVLAILYVYYYHIGIIQFAALCFGIFLLYNPVKSLSRIPLQMQKCMASASNVFDLLNKQPAIQDAPDAVVLKAARAVSPSKTSPSPTASDQYAVKDLNLVVERTRSMRSSVPARRQEHRALAHPALLRSAAGRDQTRRSAISARSRKIPSASTSAWSRRRPFFSTTRSTKTSATVASMPRRRDHRRGQARLRA